MRSLELWLSVVVALLATLAEAQTGLSQNGTQAAEVPNLIVNITSSAPSVDAVNATISTSSQAEKDKSTLITTTAASSSTSASTTKVSVVETFTIALSTTTPAVETSTLALSTTTFSAATSTIASSTGATTTVASTSSLPTETTTRAYVGITTEKPLNFLTSPLPTSTFPMIDVFSTTQATATIAPAVKTIQSITVSGLQSNVTSSFVPEIILQSIDHHLTHPNVIQVEAMPDPAKQSDKVLNVTVTLPSGGAILEAQAPNNVQVPLNSVSNSPSFLNVPPSSDSKGSGAKGSKDPSLGVLPTEFINPLYPPSTSVKVESPVGTPVSATSEKDVEVRPIVSGSIISVTEGPLVTHKVTIEKAEESVSPGNVNHEVPQTGQNSWVSDSKVPYLGSLFFPPILIKPILNTGSSLAESLFTARAAFLEAISAPLVHVSNIWPFGNSQASSPNKPTIYDVVNEEVVDGRPNLQQIVYGSNGRQRRESNEDLDYVVPHVWTRAPPTNNINLSSKKSFQSREMFHENRQYGGAQRRSDSRKDATPTKLDSCGAFLTDMSTSVCRRFEKYTLRSCLNDLESCSTLAQQDLTRLMNICSKPSEEVVCKMAFKSEPTTECKVYEFSVGKILNLSSEKCATQISNLSNKLLN